MKIYSLKDHGIPFRECVSCLMNNHATAYITFDKEGECNYCRNFRKTKARLKEFTGQPGIEAIVTKIKEEGRSKKYDCIIGLSGGVDSSYVAYLVKKHGLRALAIHFDNGWNTELATQNIENIIRHTGFDLYTYVINWEEFKDLQRAYLAASVVDIEVLTDHMIAATLFSISKKYGIRYIISGTNHATESVLAPDWVFNKRDLTNILNIHRKFGRKKLKTFPQLGYFTRFYHFTIRRVRFIEFLNMIDYRKDEAKKVIQEEFEWRDYGGKHYESVWTKFYQGYLLPEKFGVDKRIGHLSNLILNGEISKEKAREELQQPPIPLSEKGELLDYILKKLSYTAEEWTQVMNARPVPHEAYGTENDKGLYRLSDKIGSLPMNLWNNFKIRLGSPAKRLVKSLLSR